MTTSAKIIADNLSADDVRITTFEVTYPRFLMAELNTHRTIAKSSASSRAIPVVKRIHDVASYPFIPAVFGKNMRGMQAEEVVSDREAAQARQIWQEMIGLSLKAAMMLEKLGVHKQFANRVLEPYAYATTVLTGTEWENFFKLRNHKAAQPEFQELARLMEETYKSTVPHYNQNAHLPFIQPDEEQLDISILRRVSSARCARVSYKSLETGNPSTIDEDEKLCIRLMEEGHMSPFDHVATADRLITREHDDKLVWERKEDHRHFYGWIPYRVELEGLSPSRRF